MWCFAQKSLHESCRMGRGIVVMKLMCLLGHCTIATRFFPGVKAAGSLRWAPIPVNRRSEGIDPYLYCPSVRSRLVMRRTFPYFLHNNQSYVHYCLHTYNKLLDSLVWICSVKSKVSGPGSVVGIATAYGLDGPGIESRWGEIFPTCPDRPWGPPSLLYSGYRVFPGGKVLPGRDADPLTPF